MRIASVITGCLIGSNCVQAGWLGRSEGGKIQHEKAAKDTEREIRYNPIEDMVWPLTETDLDVLSRRDSQ